MTLYSTAWHYFRVGVLVFVLTALTGLALGVGHSAPAHARVHTAQNANN